MVVQDLRPITPRSNRTRNESDITSIARHHSATPTGDWKHFWNYWQTKGWGTGGYHEIILRDGTVQLCYEPNEVTNGIAKHNSNTYHICVVGNASFTEAQERVWEERALLAIKRFGLSVRDVKGHNEFKGASTACPGIDMNVVRKRLIEASNPVVAESKKEGVRMFKPSTQTLIDEMVQFLEIAHKNGILTSDQWAIKAKEGTLTLDDAVALQATVFRRSIEK